MKIKMKNKKGFSLVEVLFVLLILSIGVAAVASLMVSNIKNSIVAKDQVIASELAQEGIEIAINIKSNRDISNKFTTDMPNGTTSNYRVSYGDSYNNVKNAIDYNRTFAEETLQLNNNHYYHTGSGVDTRFHRRLSFLIDQAAPDTSATVTSEVTWNDGGFPGTCNISNKCVSVTAVLPDQN